MKNWCKITSKTRILVKIRVTSISNMCYTLCTLRVFDPFLHIERRRKKSYVLWHLCTLKNAQKPCFFMKFKTTELFLVCFWLIFDTLFYQNEHKKRAFFKITLKLTLIFDHFLTNFTDFSDPVLKKSRNLFSSYENKKGV